MSERFSGNISESAATRQGFIDLINQHIDIEGNDFKRVNSFYVKGEFPGFPTETITFARHLVKGSDYTYHLEYAIRIARHYDLIDKGTNTVSKEQSAVRISLPYGADGDFSIEGIELLDPRTSENQYVDETLGRLTMLKLFNELA